MASFNQSGYGKFTASPPAAAPPKFGEAAPTNGIPVSSSNQYYTKSYHTNTRLQTKTRVPWSSGLCECFSDRRNCKFHSFPTKRWCSGGACKHALQGRIALKSRNSIFLLKWLSFLCFFQVVWHVGARASPLARLLRLLIKDHHVSNEILGAGILDEDTLIPFGCLWDVGIQLFLNTIAHATQVFFLLFIIIAGELWL